MARNPDSRKPHVAPPFVIVLNCSSLSFEYIEIFVTDDTSEYSTVLGPLELTGDAASPYSAFQLVGSERVTSVTFFDTMGNSHSSNYNIPPITTPPSSAPAIFWSGGGPSGLNTIIVIMDSASLAPTLNSLTLLSVSKLKVRNPYRNRTPKKNRPK